MKQWIARWPLNRRTIRHMRWLAFAPLVVFAIWQWPMLESQQSVLLRSEQFTLYSLNAKTYSIIKNRNFHRFPILGEMKIVDAKLKHQLVSSLYRAFEEPTIGEAACHHPRHGIRAIKGRRSIEVTICFECTNANIYENGRRRHEQMTPSPEPIFNVVLRIAKIPIDKRHQ